MGWSRGLDINGEEIGYAIDDICHHEGCEVAIDRGLSHHCGELHSPRMGGNVGCGGFFCGEHITMANLCLTCINKTEDEDDE